MTAIITSYGRVSADGLIGPGLRRTWKQVLTDTKTPADKVECGLPHLRHKYFVGAGETNPRYGRMDILCKLAVGAADLCLAGDALAGINRDEIAIVGGTQLGCLEVDAQYYDTLLKGGSSGASPALFVYTLPSMFVGEVAIRFGLRGRSTLISEAANSARAALMAGARLVEKGRAPACLVLYADAFGPAAEQLTPRPNVETLGCAWLLTRQGQG
ncbi:MAG: hypothetical protein IT462_06785, partial [Planctomycetes bacterium]|nr:hypothetical protein [Planctomycetota bacterium]